MYAVKDIVQAPCFKKLGPTMFREKNLQKIDSIQLQVGPKGLRDDIGSLKRFRNNRHLAS